MKTFVVLGMARSGTSLVAKALHDEGVCMGSSFLGPGAWNPKGFWEDNDFRNLDKEILHAAGGRGADPGHIPPEPEALLAMRPKFDAKIAALISRKEAVGNELWGWKDPRTCLTAPLYNPHLTHPHYICIFREPIEAAKSLSKMMRWDLDRCLALGRIYNARILAFVREFVGLEEA